MCCDESILDIIRIQNDIVNSEIRGNVLLFNSIYDGKWLTLKTSFESTASARIKEKILLFIRITFLIGIIYVPYQHKYIHSIIDLVRKCIHSDRAYHDISLVDNMQNDNVLF